MDAIQGIDVVIFISKVLGTALGVMFFLCFLYGLTNEDVKPLKIPDRFDIGYIDDPVVQQTIILEDETPTPRPRQKPKPRPKKKQPKKVVSQKATENGCQDDQLRQDCVDALVALGTKKSEARRVAAQCLAANPQIKTVNEFIPIVFKRN